MTDAKLASIFDQLHELGARTITVGTARDPSCRAAAEAVVAAWQAADGVVLTTVDWPEHAASWLRQSRRFTAGHPDAWVVCARPAGWLAIGHRLADSTDWRPDRTVCWAALEDATLADVPGFVGLRGARADGSRWRVARGLVVREDGSRTGRLARLHGAANRRRGVMT